MEGAEGVGKTTQVGLLGEWLTTCGVPHVVAREPGGTPLGEAVRALVLDVRVHEPPPEAELFLILAARAAYVRDVVRPALARGMVVLSDRFDLSTLAYQGYGRGLNLEQVRQCNAVATGGLAPDLVLWLDAPVEEGLARRVGAGAELDRIEREGVAFLRRVVEGYHSLADASDRVERIDATRGPKQVHEAIRASLAAHLPGTFANLDEKAP